MPRVSIVIPTRNRARLLAGALRTALAQTFDDLEIVVSNNGCTDDTDSVVQAIRDSRIRLVHTGRALPMHEHWDFAVEQARGEFVTFLCDDDALHPRAIELANDAVRREGDALAVWSAAHYVHPQVGSASGNRLTFQRYSNNIIPVTAESALVQAFALRSSARPVQPLMLNCLVQRARLDRVRSALGRVFLPTSPDYAFLAGVLSTVDRYLWLDAPLMLSGTAPESIGNNSRDFAPSLRTFVAELEAAGVAWVECVPLRQVSSPNSIADTLLRVRARLPALQRYELDWAAYYHQCGKVNEHRARLGLDVTQDVTELEARLDAGGDVLRARVRAAGDAPAPSNPRIPIGTRLLLAPAPLTAAPLGGAGAPFQDIVSAAAWLERGLPDASIDPQQLAREILASILTRGRPPRRVVLYGMGENGRFLAEELSTPLRHRGIELCACDDACTQRVPNVTPIEATCLAPRDADTFIVVTPWDGSRISERLLQAGWVHGRQWISWREVATAIVASGALTPA